MKTYYQDEAAIIYNGDCREVLPTLEAESVQTCITSPPYWGLRDYGIEPSVWDGDEGCGHEWGDEVISRANDSNRGTLEWSTGGNPSTKVKGTPSSQGAFCSLCGAWRGVLGLEPTPELYVSHMVEIFREVRRVLRNDGTVWLNLGDTYNSRLDGSHGGWNGDYGERTGKPQRVKNEGSGIKPTSGLKPKNLIGIPWHVAFALQADGWYLRSDIIWHKPNPMPESVRDRPTKAHEYIFLLSKSASYYYDADAIREGHEEPWRSTGNPERGGLIGNTNGMKRIFDKRAYNPLGRNKRTVWTVATHPTPEAHFATFPPDLIKPCILAGAPVGGVVLDHFSGTGTTVFTSKRLGRRAVGIEAKAEYCAMLRDDIRQGVLMI